MRAISSAVRAQSKSALSVSLYLSLSLFISLYALFGPSLAQTKRGRGDPGAKPNKEGARAVTADLPLSGSGPLPRLGMSRSLHLNPSD